MTCIRVIASPKKYPVYCVKDFATISGCGFNRLIPSPTSNVDQLRDTTSLTSLEVFIVINIRPIDIIIYVRFFRTVPIDLSVKRSAHNRKCFFKSVLRYKQDWCKML